MGTEKTDAAIDAAHEVVGRFDEGGGAELSHAIEVLRAALIKVYEEREADVLAGKVLQRALLTTALPFEPGKVISEAAARAAKRKRSSSRGRR